MAFATSILLWRDLTPTANGFKPAFINRFDDVVIFDPLNLDELGRIVDIAVDRLGERLADRRLTLEVTPAACEWLALEGFDPACGARPLRRLVQRVVAKRKRGPNMEVLRGSRISVISDRPQPRQLDGDVIEPSTKLEVSVRAGALWVCVYQPDTSDDIAAGAPTGH